MPRKRHVDSSSEKRQPSSGATDMLDSAGEVDGEVEESLETIRSAFQRFGRESEALRKEKSALETEIEVLRASTSVSSPGTKTTTTSRIKKLENELRASKKETNKYKSRYEKLRAAELKRERLELEAGFEGGSNTLEGKYLEAKKLLRSFRTVVEEIVLEDPGDEEKYPDCAICYEELTKDTAAAFSCEHIFHMACIRELDRHSKEQDHETVGRLTCPTCRRTWHFSDVVRVRRTAGEQWQDLIDLATAWAKLDAQGDDVDMETSDKTSEPSFIENDIESAEEEAGEPGEAVSAEGGESDGERRLKTNAPQTPPRAEKKRRLEELAAARSAKKQKR